MRQHRALCALDSQTATRFARVLRTPLDTRIQERIVNIAWCRSRSDGREFPIAQFSADTDMVTNGWASLTTAEIANAVPFLAPEEASFINRVELFVDGGQVQI